MRRLALGLLISALVGLFVVFSTTTTDDSTESARVSTSKAGPSTQRQLTGVRPEIASFIEDNQSTYGSLLRVGSALDWDAGERLWAETTTGSYLLYTSGGEVVSVYVDDDGEHVLIFGPEIQSEPLPEYRILARDQVIGQGMYGDVMVPSLSRNTPAETRERTLRRIMSKEGFTQGGLYCSEKAWRADVMGGASTEAARQALRRCTLGAFVHGQFESYDDIY